MYKKHSSFYREVFIPSTWRETAKLVSDNSCWNFPESTDTKSYISKIKLLSGFRNKNCHWTKFLAAEPQADMLPFQFQNECAVKHFQGAWEEQENEISCAFKHKLLVPDRKRSRALPALKTPSAKGSKHHTPLLVPTPLPKSLHWSSTMPGAQSAQK